MADITRLDLLVGLISSKLRSIPYVTFLTLAVVLLDFIVWNTPHFLFLPD